jgi:hypothetical protein
MPTRKFTLPIRTSITPEVKIAYKSWTGKVFEIMNKKTHSLGADRKSENSL